jgi:N-acetylneuraminate lyase
MFNKVSGLICAPVTPFNQDGSVNYKAIQPYCEALNRNGASGAFVNGTTGEGLSLSTEERMKAAEKWIEYAPQNFKIIIHIGHTSINESIKLAKHAQDIGAFGIASLPSIFFKPTTVSQLVEHCAIEAAAAPNLPYYFYHIPSLSGVNFPVIDIIKKADEKIPNFFGVKFTFEALADALSCVQYKNGKYNILFGRDEMFMSGYLLGMKGAVGSTYNVAPKLYLDIMRLCDQGKLEEAKTLQAKSVQLINELVGSGSFFGALKVCLSFLGIEVGNPRSPLPKLTDPQKTEFKNKLDSIGFFEYALDSK